MPELVVQSNQSYPPRKATWAAVDVQTFVAADSLWGATSSNWIE
jgi:hypothetical protein